LTSRIRRVYLRTMSEVHDVIAACPIRPWMDRRFRAELPLLSGHKVILSYSLDAVAFDTPPRIEPAQVITRWGEYLSEGETIREIVKNINLQVELEIQISLRQLRAVRFLLEAMIRDVDEVDTLIKLAEFANALLMTAEEAEDFGWQDWLERVHELYCPEDYTD